MRARETTSVSRASYVSVAARVETATHTRSAAKTRPSTRFETLLVSLAPTMPPPIDAAVKSATMTPASAVIVSVPARVREASPKAAVMTMTSRDVAEARFIGYRSARCSAGTIAKPPPTPKNPVRKPVSVASATTRDTVPSVQEPLSTLLSPASFGESEADGRIWERTMKTATAPRRAQKESMRARAETSGPSADPAHVPTRPAKANRAPSRHATFPLRARVASETVAVSPTMMRDRPVAW